MRNSFLVLRRVAVGAILSTLVPRGLAIAQWQLATVDTKASFRGLSVISDKVAWASGTRGTVVRTVDGGATWEIAAVPVAATLDLRSIIGLSADVAVTASAGLADSGQAKIFRTMDGGKSWSLAYSTDIKGVFIDALAFWDANHGIALSDPVDGRLFLLLTDDGGATWTRVPPDAIPAALPNEGAFAASGTCMTVWGSGDVWIGTGGSAAARVFHSSDRGRTWTVANTPVHAGDAASGVFAVVFRDGKHGLAVGGDYSKAKEGAANAALSDDGGLTWRVATGPLASAFLSGVAYVGDRGAVVAVGTAGTYVSLNRGDAWAQTDTLGFNAVRFGAETFGIAVGSRGRIARFLGPPAIKKP